MTLKEWIKTIEIDPEKLFSEHNAKSYIPVERKMAMIEVAAHGNTYLDGDKEAMVDPMCINIDYTGYATIDTVLKSMFLIQCYLMMYFDVNFDDKEAFTLEDYDNIVEHNYLHRINRVADTSTNWKIKRQVIEQQNDFKAFEKMLNKELANELAIRNDPYKRIKPLAKDIADAFFERIEMDISPEKVESAVKELKELTNQIEQRKAQEQ